MVSHFLGVVGAEAASFDLEADQQAEEASSKLEEAVGK